MPRSLFKKTCVRCSREWETRSRKARTCSPKCRAELREIEHGPTKGAPLRDYPEELVSRVRSMYESGHSLTEIQQVVKGAKVQNIVRRYGIATRPAIKRDQSGSNNHMWKGDRASYKALHLRVSSVRGKPSVCSACETTSGRFEWANLTGDYGNVYDFIRLCVGCHRKMDSFRRSEVGATLSAHVRKGGDA